MAFRSSNQAELRQFLVLVTPSWTSAGLAVLLALLVMGRLVLEQIKSGIGPGAVVLQTIADSNSTLADTYSIPANTFIRDVPVFALWACVGAITYFLVVDSATLLTAASRIKKQLSFVHADRRTLTREFGEKLLTRILGLVLLYLSTVILFRLALPYALASAITVGSMFNLLNALYAAAGFVTLVVGVQLVVVAIRLILLRPRLLSGN
jgi:hypothetical protein